MKPSDLSEFFSLLGKAKKEKEEEFDNLLKEADINLDDLTSSLVSGIKEAKEDQKKQKKNEEKLIEQLDSIIDVIENPKEVKDITEPAVTVGVPEDFDISKLEEEDTLDVQDWNDGKDVKFTEVDAVDIIKPEPIKTPEISDTVAQAIKFIEETNIKEEIENSDETNLDKLKTEIKQVRDILYKVLAHGPGSGEVNLLKLDDVDEDTAKVDGKVLQYDASSGKFVGATSSGIGTESSVNTSGIITATKFVGDGSGLTGITASGSGVVVQDEGSNIGTAATINFIGSNVTAALSGGIANVTVTSGVTTANVRTGILDVAGIATFRNDTLIGSGVTLSPDGDVFATGVTTSSSFVGDLTGDVTGTASNATQLNSQAASYYLDYDNFSNTPTIPSNNNQLTNGAGYITGSSLNASNLSSGTIPDARFPSTLPAIDGSALTGIAVTDNIRTNTNATFLQNVNVSGTTTATTFIGNLTGNVTGNVSGSSGSSTGNAATATALANARTIGGVSFDGSANIDLPGVNSSGNQDTTGNAATATKLAATKTIAGVAFDGSANISLNNNAITNGAGYITATLTDEEVQDKVGAMFTGNTETGITATYQDADGTIDLVVGTLNQDTTGNAATATALETARNIGGVSFDGSANIDLPGVNSAGNQNTTGTSAGLTGTPSITVNAVNGTTGTFTAGITTSLRTNKINLGDNEFINVGLGSDLKIYHDSESIISHTGTGVFKIQGNGANNTFLRAKNAQNSVTLVPNGEVILHNNGTPRFETTNTGAKVTGDLEITGVLTYEDVTNVDSVGVITARSGVLVGSGITLSPDGDVFATGVTTSTTFVGALTGNVTGNASGSSGSCTGNAATATALETARNIGGVSFDGSANIDLPGVNSSGNQNTSGTAAGLSGTPNISCGTVTGSTGTFTTGVTTSLRSNKISLGDSEKIHCGIGSDLEIFHSGNHSFIKDVGTGSLFIASNQFNAYNQAANEKMIVATQNSSVELYHDNTLRLTTSDSGVDVTGSFNVSNIVNIGAASPTTSDNGQLNVYTTTSGGKAQFVHGAGFGGVRLAGTAAASGASLVFSNNYNSGTFSDHWTIQHGGLDDSLKFLIGGTGGTEAFRIESNGKVGISSDSPTAKLDVNGDVRVGSGITLSPDGDVFATGVTTSTTFVGALTGNVTGNASGSSGSCTGNAATATALETARTIAGVSFDGSANISLNNNAITNGAGYITATLTDEQVQDVVGAMFSSNTETGITATYQDADGTIDLVVGTLNQDTTGNAATATALETARNIGGVSFDGSANIDLPGVNSAGNQNTTGTSAGLTGTPNISCGTIAGSTGTFTGDVDIADKIVHTGDTNTAIRFPADDTISLETAGTEAARITSDGKFGFGTGANIDERGHIEVASGTCRLKLQTGNTAVAGFVLQTSAIRFDIQAQNNFFQIYDNTVDEDRLRITSGGSVNIGGDYTQTTYRTQIEATDNNVLRLINDSDDSNGVELVLYKDSASPADGDAIGGVYFQGNDDGGNSVFYANIEGFASDVSDGTEDGYIRFRTRLNGSIGERVRIDSQGDMGIGTADPQAKLHISSGNSGDCELIIEADEDNNNENDNPRILFRQDGGHDESMVGMDNNTLILANSVSSSGGIVFKTGTTSPYTNATERMRILDSGGLTFNGDTSSANALDDYEEGTFTPSYNTSNDNIGSVTYDVRGGKYTKIGRMVYFTLRMRTDSISDVGSGTIKITGLPYTHVNSTHHRAVTHNIYSANWTSDDAPTLALFVHNQSYFQLYQKNYNEDSSSLPSSSFNTGANDNDVRITGMYEAA